MSAGQYLKKPSDPPIAEKFNTYRFADYKKKVIDLLAGDDGERGGPGPRAGMEVLRGMEKAKR